MTFEAAALLLMLALVGLLLWRNRSLARELANLAFDKRSQSVRYGKLAEQFFPFMKDYPYDPEGFRFLGTPIDGVQFEKDTIIFVEFKAAGAALSARQSAIKELVKDKKVQFLEMAVR